MKRRSNKEHVAKLFLCAMLAVLVWVGTMMAVSATELEWNLLTDGENDYTLKDVHNGWERSTEADGTAYMKTKAGKRGAIYVYDDKNLLGSYASFSMEGDFYFDSFPSGLRDGYTPEESPLSFLAWLCKDIKTGTTKISALRLDSKGYIYSGSQKTDVRLTTGRWYNIRCVIMTESGQSELFVNGKKVLDFSIMAFDPELYTSNSLRFFDGYFNWSAKMKNLSVKTDNDYEIKLLREDAADFLGYQVTKPQNGSFTLRALLGVNERVHDCVGYEVLILDTDKNGKIVSKERSVTSDVIHEAVLDAKGNAYGIEGMTGYKYASALDIPNIPSKPTGSRMEVVIRPYVLNDDGIRRYGLTTSLSYTGALDAEGYPVFTSEIGERFSVAPTDDTYIFAGQPAVNYGNDTALSIRNTGSEASGYFRAAYFKFTLDAEAVKALDTATAVKLRLCITGHENDTSRKQYDMILQGVGTNWSENQLNYKNYQTLAPTGQTIYQGAYQLGAYFTADILPYLKAQPVNQDGTLTVAFRLFNEGHSDAIVAFVGSKESSSAPVIVFENSLYSPTLNLSKRQNSGYEPWGYAEHVVSEWFDEIIDKVYPKDENGNLIYHEIDDFAPEGYDSTEASGDFTVPIDWKNGTIWTTDATTGYRVSEKQWKSNRFARTLSTLGTSTAVAFLETDFAKMITKHDVYGGITNAGFVGEATGFFHVEKHGGRCYIIDPLGNPYIAQGINTVDLGGTQNQKDYTLANYGLEEDYFEQITKELKDVGINLLTSSAHTELLNVKDGLPVVVSVSTNGQYMRSLGRQQIAEGQFPFNNTINVFDPDFVKSAKETAAKTIAEGGYADNPFVFGYTSDNELPSGDDILTRYLTLDPDEEPTNGFSYAVAWTWLKHRMGTECPTLDEYYASPDFLKMNREFLGFIYAHYYRVTREAIEAVDSNHMYIGSRINGTLYDSEDYHRAAGYYLDIITANLYGGLNPSGTRMVGFYRNAGIPFIVTEFFAKSMDAIDANGYMMANSTGSGILTLTQQARSDYYEHYSLAMIESEACVGWIWYCFRDNDQSVFTSDGTNRLIMLNCSYGLDAKGNTFMDMNTGMIYTAAEIGDYEVVYKGADLHSNQNVNKGLYNGSFSSTVAIYEYDANGKLLASTGYDVEHPESRKPEDGTVLTGKNGETYKIGKAPASDGGYTETVLTVYKGQYVAFADAIKNVSDHLIGLVKYFDAK